MRVPRLALPSLPTTGLGSLHDLIVRFGLDAAVRAVLVLPASTRAPTRLPSSCRHLHGFRDSPPCGGGGGGGGDDGGPRPACSAAAVAQRCPALRGTALSGIPRNGRPATSKVETKYSMGPLHHICSSSVYQLSPKHGGRCNSSKFMGCLKAAIQPTCTASCNIWFAEIPFEDHLRVRVRWSQLLGRKCLIRFLLHGWNLFHLTSWVCAAEFALCNFRSLFCLVVAIYLADYFSRQWLHQIKQKFDGNWQCIFGRWCFPVVSKTKDLTE